MSDNHSQNKVKLPQKELLKSLTSVDENPNNEPSSEELVEREPIENTPFWILGNVTDGYFLAMGKFRVSPVFDEKSEVLDYMLIQQWNLILTIIGCCYQVYQEESTIVNK